MATVPAKKAASSSQPPVSPDSQASLVRYTQECVRFLGKSYNFRARMQEIDRIYQRETDYTTAQRRALAANKAGDASKMQNVVIPVVMPQVESLLTELSEIFLQSYPLFPVFSKPDMADAALQMESVIGEQGVRFGWAAELLQAMRDGLKYNLMAVEVCWMEQKTFAITSDATAEISKGVATETLYAGNMIKRRNPYNLILDTRVPAYEIHTRGEYAGYTEMISRIEMKRRFAELDPTRTMNARAAFESGGGQFTTSSSDNAYFVPQVNPFALIETSQSSHDSINWHAWAGLEDNNQINYSDMYEWTVLYARILPSEHRIHGPNGSTPQIWKFVTVNRQICVFAERQTNGHDLLPIIVAQATEDGLDWQSKSFADNAASFQALGSALFNSGIESQRRKVYDRMLYDPSRVNKADIDNTSPIARIAVKQEAYGKPVSEAVYQVPYKDDNVNEIFNVGQMVIEMADVANGQNRVQRGQFQKGNKTRHEFQDTMDASNARPRMTALVLENRLFTPIKTILRFNTLQYQPPTNVFNRNTKQQVAIDPVKLRAAALEFKMADGLMPTDAFVNMQLFQTILQMAAQYPLLIANWDILGMIFYWLKLEGATWVDDFKIQQTGAPNETVPPNPGANAAPAV